MNKLDIDYQKLLQDILDNGVEKDTRNGKVLSVFGREIRHNMSDGFPLLTTKKMYLKGIIVELMWFLKGSSNIKYLLDNNCHIWDGDCYSSYFKKTENKTLESIPFQELHLYGKLSGTISDTKFRQYTKEEFINEIKNNKMFCDKWGELGPIYGFQWRKCGTPQIDQISNLIRNLKENPDSRRIIVSAWNVSQIEDMTLPPCHYSFQCYTRQLSFQERLNEKNKRHPIDTCDLDTEEKLNRYNIPTRGLSLKWTQRSADFPLGVPFNIGSYGLLLEILSKIVNMVPDVLIGSFGDSHIYKNQIDGVKEQITRTCYELPSLEINTDFEKYDFDRLPIDLFTVKNYQSHPTINFPLSN